MPKRRYLESVTPVDNTYVVRPDLSIEDIEGPVTHIGIFGQGLKNYHDANLYYNIATGEVTDYTTKKPVSKKEIVDRIFKNYTPKSERRKKAFLDTVFDVMYDRDRKPEFKKYDLSNGTIRRIRKD